MKVTIVIPVFNGADYLSRCLDACLEQDYDKGIIEIIVADDGSNDQTPEIAVRYPVRYVRQENAGAASARNLGWRAGSGDIVCFTDVDCVPEPQWVRKLVDIFEREQVDAVGGGYTLAESNLLGRLIHDEIDARHAGMGGATDFLGSFNLAVRRPALVEIDGFNPEYKSASGEDNDLSYRLRQAGFNLFFDRDIKVEHAHLWHFRNYFFSQARHGFWRVKMYADHPHMVRGDDYAGLADLLLPPMALLLLPLLAVPLLREAGLAVLVLMLVAAFRRHPVMMSMIFIRSFFRGFGLAAGTIHFLILRQRSIPGSPDAVS